MVIFQDITLVICYIKLILIFVKNTIIWFYFVAKSNLNYALTQSTWTPIFFTMGVHFAIPDWMWAAYSSDVPLTMSPPTSVS